MSNGDTTISHNRRGERGRGCAISRTCFSRFARARLTFCSRDAHVLLARCSRFAHAMLAFCSRGARVMLAWHAWHSFLVPPTVVPFYRPGVFERVFWGILGAGVFVVLGEGRTPNYIG